MSKAKELVQKLQQKPRDPVALQAVKRHLLEERRYLSLVKVIEWWSTRAPSPDVGARELYEATFELEQHTAEKERARELYHKVLELDPDHVAARERLQVLEPDQAFEQLIGDLEAESVRPRPLSSRPPTGAPLPSLRAAVAGSRSSVPAPPGPSSSAPPAPRPPASRPAKVASPARASLPLPPAGLFPTPGKDRIPSLRGAPPAARPAPLPTPAPLEGLAAGEDDSTQPRLESQRPPAAAPTPALSYDARDADDEDAPTHFYAGGAALAAGGASAFAADADDEDDDESPRFALAHIVGPGEAGAAAGRGAVVDVIRLRHQTVLGSATVGFRGTGGCDALRIQRTGPRKFRVVTRAPMPGWLRVAAEGPGAQAHPLEAPTRFSMALGDCAELTHDGVVHRLRVVARLAPPVRDHDPIPFKRYGGVVFVAVAFHLLGLVGVSTLNSMGVSFRVEDRPQAEVFAEARLKPPVPREEAPKPRPLRLKPKLAPKPPPTEEQVQIPKSLRTRLRSIASARTEKTAAARLVAALQSPVAGEGKTVKEVVSNIDAVQGGEASGAFKIGGTLAGIEGKGVNIVSGGGGDLGTLGGSEATDKLARLERKPSGKVRGKVSSVSALARVQGSLSQGEVLRVLNQNTHKIQRCYEQQLTTNPSLTGKLTLSWTIKPNGRVSGVQQTSNTLGNNAVSKCIASVIQRLKFPEPKGGPVTVTFPWIFQRAP